MEIQTSKNRSTFADAITQYRNVILIVLFSVGILVRCIFIWHPADDVMLNSWRESDYTQIARAFFREDMNPLFPRVDWRGTGPGYAEMELPVIPWTAACLYHVVGYHEVVLRLLSALCSILSVVVFWRLARRFFPTPWDLVALTLFSLNGLLIALSGAIQPEPLMILLILLSALYAVRWHDEDRPKDLLIACAFLSLAMLGKLPAAHLGILFAFLVIQRYGVKGSFRVSVFLGASLAVIPATAWYLWAHHLYHATGLSLGISNETHLLSAVMIAHPGSWVRSLCTIELREAFGYAGIFLVIPAIFEKANWKNGLVVWYGAIVAFYIATADTSADSWAYYYHSLSVAPAALLMTSGLMVMYTLIKNLDWGGAGVTLRYGFVAILIVAVVCVSVAHGARLIRGSRAHGDLEELYRCVPAFAKVVPEGSRIIVRGGTRFDAHRHPVAFNASMAFLWMDRKGVNYAEEDYSSATLLHLHEEGMDYWVAGKNDLKDSSVVRALGSRIALIDSCSAFRLYEFTNR